MDYDFPPYRPPNEAYSLLLRATRGCPWNRCTFCTMYKNLKFGARMLEEVKKDILTAGKLWPGVKTAFIGDSDSLTWKELAEVVRFLREKLPHLERVTSYTRARTLVNLSPERLKALKDAGLDRLHVGLESGDAVTLEILKKGADPDTMIAGGKRAKEFGFELSFYVISGGGGTERWREHAVETAKVLNEVNSHFIRLRSLTLLPGSPLLEKVEKGEFTPVTPLIRLKETKLLLENLEVEGTWLYSDHHTNVVRDRNTHRVIYPGVEGRLPEDKEMMLKVLEQAIEEAEALGEDRLVDAEVLRREGWPVSL